MPTNFRCVIIGRSYGAGAAESSNFAAADTLTIVIKAIVMKDAARLDAYLLDTLMPDLVGHDRQPSAFLVYLYLSHQAGRRRTRSVVASLQAIAVDTGLSKSAVQRGLRTLARRRLVRIDKRSPTAVPSYMVLRPWIRRP